MRVGEFVVVYRCTSQQAVMHMLQVAITLVIIYDS